MFECRRRKNVWLRDCERAGSGNHIFDLMKIICVIRGNVEQTVASEGAMNGQQKFRGKSTPAMVPSFRPWVGKEQVKSTDAFGGHHMLHGISDLDSQHSRVFKVFICNFAADLANPTKQAFDAEKIVRWFRARHGSEKNAVTTTEVDFDRSATCEHFGEVQPRRQRPWNIFDRRFVFAQFATVPHKRT